MRSTWRNRSIAAVTAASLMGGGLLVSSAAAARPSETAGAVVPMTAPQVDGVSPGIGGPGDIVEITGMHFSDGVNPPAVTFLSVPAEVTEYTDTLIMAVVPVVPDPPDGFIELRVTTSGGFGNAPFKYEEGSDGELSAPKLLSAKVFKGKIRLRWNAPESGAATVTAYEWRYQEKGKTWSPWKKSAKAGKARTQVIKRIRPKRVYVFEVRAVAGTTPGPVATVEARGR